VQRLRASAITPANASSAEHEVRRGTRDAPRERVYPGIVSDGGLAASSNFPTHASGLAVRIAAQWLASYATAALPKCGRVRPEITLVLCAEIGLDDRCRYDE
jgi:hypothetical protein